MKITVIGAGYVGLVTAACLARDHKVTCIEKDAGKLRQLQWGKVPFHEPQLTELLCNSNIRFTNAPDITAYYDADLVFVAVGTPASKDGSTDLTAFNQAIRQLTPFQPKVVVIKSTVPVGTCAKVAKALPESLIISNPEFLRESTAVTDFLEPDRIVLGANRPLVTDDAICQLYAKYPGEHYTVSWESAELSKYASNAMLATRISFANELANFCSEVGADISEVTAIIGSDSRIGSQFLKAGCGYGGSCLPKDIKSLCFQFQQRECYARILEAVDSVNEEQGWIIFDEVERLLAGSLTGKRVTIWGLAFKAGTDDLRDSPGVLLAERLRQEGCEVVTYDPMGLGTDSDAQDAVSGADALVVMTEAEEFKTPNWGTIKSLMRCQNLVDGRNIYDPKAIRSLGFTYRGVGR